MRRTEKHRLHGACLGLVARLTAYFHVLSKHALIATCVATCILTLGGCGERFTSEGNTLSKAIIDHLVAKNLCASESACHTLQMYGGHGDQVRFSFYAINDPLVTYAITGFVASEGLKLTHNIPITLSFFPNPHDHYMGFDFSNPTMKLEVKK